MFSFLWGPVLSPCLSYQLLTATAHQDSIVAILKRVRDYSARKFDAVKLYA
jgi:hypothetical protein